MTMLTDERDLVREIFIARHPRHRAGRDHARWDERPLDQMASKIWHGDDDDHGAMTRFGMGWGPLEVVRADREIKNDKGPKVYRVLEVWGNGKRLLTMKFSPTGRSSSVIDARSGRLLVPFGEKVEPADLDLDEAQVGARDAVLGLANALYALPTGDVPDAVWAALDVAVKAVE